MRRRAALQSWTLSRIHRLLRPLRTKVSALAATLRRERQCRLVTTAPTPTPTRRPPLRRTYQTRKRKRGGADESDEDGQYIPEPIRAPKSKSKPIEKSERKWSPEVIERVGAVVDAFRVLADVVYDEQVETEGLGGSSVLSLRDMCVRMVAEDIEPSAMAAAGDESGSDDDGELVDATKIVDERFEEIPEHLRRMAIIPYVLSMIKQHIDTIAPLPQLWNHILAICLSSSASPSAANTADVLQICSNLFSASLRQPRSGSRGLASVYRNVVGCAPDKIPPELFCKTILAELVPSSLYALELEYTLPPNYLSQFTPGPDARPMRSPTKTPARPTRGRPIPPTPPTFDLSSLSDDPTGHLFPIRAFLSRSISHLVAELAPSQLVEFINTAATALANWVGSDETIIGPKLREHRADAIFVPRHKTSDLRSLAPRVCARIGDWTGMVLSGLWCEDEWVDLDPVGRCAVALGRVIDVVDGRSVWIDVGDPFCALGCVYISRRPAGEHVSKLVGTLGRLPLTARNCGLMAGTFASLDDLPPSNQSPPLIRALKTYTRAFAQANCPHLEATLLQLVLNEQAEADVEVEEMLENAEARWDVLHDSDWQWARPKWRWDEITNTWVERNKTFVGLEYFPRTTATGKLVKIKKKKEAIVVSSDTEGGLFMDEDEDDVFAAIPATARYAVPPRRRTSAVESDGSLEAVDEPRIQRRATFLVEDSEDENAEGEYEDSEQIETPMDSDDSESDFDWAQYNGRYHPHDVSGSRNGARKRSVSQALSVPKSKPNPKPTRVVSAPIPAPVRRVAVPIHTVTASKRLRVVVEIPIRSKRPLISTHSKPTKPRILGNNNTSRPFSSSSSSSPDPIIKARLHPATTSTLSRLCHQFSHLSSDDEDLEVIPETDVEEEDTDGTENENVPSRMEMPSSDDMDLFQIVTPLPSRVRPIRR